MITDIERYDSNMIDVHFESSGIDVILYIGENPHSKINRIKVSNINLLSNKTDLFTIFLPSFDILGDVKIDDTKLTDIFRFVELNLEIINQYSNNEIDTGTFITRLKPIDV